MGNIQVLKTRRDLLGGRQNSSDLKKTSCTMEVEKCQGTVEKRQNTFKKPMKVTAIVIIIIVF